MSCECGFQWCFCPCCGKLLDASISCNQLGRAGARRTSRVKKADEDSASAAAAMAAVATSKASTASTECSAPEAPNSAEETARTAVVGWMQNHSAHADDPTYSAFDFFCLCATVQDPVSMDASMRTASLENPVVKRQLAQRWLAEDDGVRTVYEDAAAQWCEHVRMATEKHQQQQGQEEARQTAPLPSPAAAGVSHTEPSSCSLSRNPPAALPDKPSAAALRDKKRKRRTCPRTSFAVFRASMKGMASTAEVLQAWRALTPEEKAPYDRAAAAQRTQQCLQDAAEAGAKRRGGAVNACDGVTDDVRAGAATVTSGATPVESQMTSTQLSAA